MAYEDELMHYGTPRKSGRYPWGSGDDPYQSGNSFLQTYDGLKKEGLSEKEISSYFGMSIKQLRARKSNVKNEIRAANVSEALKLQAKGYSQTAIANHFGKNESTIRNWLNPSIQDRADKSKNTADDLEKAVNSKKYIDVGSGVESQLGISRTCLDNAVEMLKDKGYSLNVIQTEQQGTGKKTYIKVLSPPNTSYVDVVKNKGQIEPPNFHSDDKGRTFNSVKDPVSISSKRVKINYADTGTGGDKDGVIEIRRGVKDLSLGNAHYAQVRIAVDGTHYLKGMAMYSDDMPDGVDIIFNTNKNHTVPMISDDDNSVLKKVKTGSDNIFGANIKPQRNYIGDDGKEHQSSLNLVNEEGDWNTWRKTLSSQMLSKQSTVLAKKQLKMSYDLKMDEYNEINSVKNPVIKQQLLNKFADSCDSDAVYLKAAGLPRQAAKVILPIPSLKENEIYAPSYHPGEEVVLIRYPHGGTFEIPTLKVNNGNKSAKRVIGTSPVDAVGINPKVAARLSGADFDGDTVLVIPTYGVKIKTTSPLAGLKDFDPQTAYPAYSGMTKVGWSDKQKQRQMGDISNLITDMTIKGASTNEIAAAVRHSMVVIDAKKHNLNYKQSYIDNNIGALKTKYQGRSNAGASTLISRAKSQAKPGRRKESIDPATGKKVYSYTGETYNKNGKDILKVISSTKMAETPNAYSLSSGTMMENIYAEHANKLKTLANQSRKESLAIKSIPYSSSSRLKYKTEVDSLNTKLTTALKNKPLERKAQLVADEKVKLIRQANPDLDKDDLKKLKGRSLTQARVTTGAKKQQIQITDKEWEAIQSGAISTNKLKQIINNSDLDELKKRAMPRESRGLTSAKKARAKSLLNLGYSMEEVADALGVSVSTIANFKAEGIKS